MEKQQLTNSKCNLILKSCNSVKRIFSANIASLNFTCDGICEKACEETVYSKIGAKFFSATILTFNVRNQICFMTLKNKKKLLLEK